MKSKVQKTDKLDTASKRKVLSSCTRKMMCSDGREITYELTRKPVKNINIRVKSDGRVFVSANPRVSLKYLDALMVSKQEFIQNALEKYEKIQRYKEERNRKTPVVLHDETLLLQLCWKIYPLFEPMGVVFPQVKIRTMKTQWGSCRPQTGVITLNRRLLEAPVEAIEYVILHEFAHFIHPNHSKDFYGLVERFMPDWKARKKLLEGII